MKSAYPKPKKINKGIMIEPIKQKSQLLKMPTMSTFLLLRHIHTLLVNKYPVFQKNIEPTILPICQRFLPYMNNQESNNPCGHRVINPY